MRAAPPRAPKTPSPGKWNGNREAHRADCVRIVHKCRIQQEGCQLPACCHGDQSDDKPDSLEEGGPDHEACHDLRAKPEGDQNEVAKLKQFGS